MALLNSIDYISDKTLNLQIAIVPKVEEVVMILDIASVSLTFMVKNVTNVHLVIMIMKMAVKVRIHHLSFHVLVLLIKDYFSHSRL